MTSTGVTNAVLRRLAVGYMRSGEYVRSAQARRRPRTNLTRLPPRDSTLDGRWTRKPFGISIIQPIYLPRPS